MNDAHIYVPSEFVGTVMDMCQDKRGIFKNMNYITPDRVDIHYELPLNEIIYDFFDALKSRTRGYASFDYEMKDYRRSELVKVYIGMMMFFTPKKLCYSLQQQWKRR